MSTALLANVLTDASGWLADFSANWYFLAIIFGVAFFDSIVPIVPSETMVIIGGVAAGQGEQWLVAVIAAGAVGAFLGDNTAYLIGDRMSGFIRRRAAHRPKLRHRLEWADEQIRVRGGLLLITARFIPGGRTALTVTSLVHGMGGARRRDLGDLRRTARIHRRAGVRGQPHDGVPRRVRCGPGDDRDHRTRPSPSEPLRLSRSTKMMR
jgi:membrane protein YqaA with SNARE-associated domain